MNPKLAITAMADTDPFATKIPNEPMPRKTTGNTSLTPPWIKPSTRMLYWVARLAIKTESVNRFTDTIDVKRAKLIAYPGFDRTNSEAWAVEGNRGKVQRGRRPDRVRR